MIEAHYKTHYNKFVNIAARRLSNNRAWAEEAVQEAYERLIKYIHTNESDTIDGLFVKVFHNAVNDKFNSEMRAATVLSEEEEDILQIKGVFECEYFLTKNILMNEVTHVLNSKHREVLRYYYLFGMDYRDINQLVTDVTSASCRKIVSRFTEEMEEKYG